MNFLPFVSVYPANRRSYIAAASFWDILLTLQ